MSIFPWIFVGLIAGYIASRALNKPGEAVFLDIALVIIGAIYGGFFFTWMSAAGVTGFKLNDMFVEVVGVLAILVVFYQVMFGRRPSAPDHSDVRSQLPAIGRASTPKVRSDPWAGRRISMKEGRPRGQKEQASSTTRSG